MLRGHSDPVVKVTVGDDERATMNGFEVEVIREIPWERHGEAAGRMEARQRLPVLEAYLGQTFEGIAVVAPDGRIRLFTPGFEHISGYREDELESMLDLVMKLAPDPETGARQWKAFEAGLGQPESQEEILEIVNKRGEHRVLRGRLYRANEDTLVHVLDITAIHQLRGTTPLNAEHYQALLDNLGIGIYSLSEPLEGTISYYNQATQDILGLPPLDLADPLSSRVLFADLEERRQILSMLTDGPRVRSRTIRATTTLLRVDDQRPVPVRLFSTGGFDREGALVRVDGALEDLSAERALAAAMAKHALLLGSLFQDTAVGVAIGTLDGRISAVNPAYCALVGYSEEELLGHEGDMITHPDDHGRSMAEIRNALLSGRNMFSFEKRYVHKDGTVFPVSVVMAAVRDDAGQVVGGIGLFERID
jgi:PAS domain S-box-containing protein